MPRMQALPAAYRPEPDRPLRWGVIGTGGIARTVMSDLLLLPDARLVAVCSRSAERGAGYAGALTVPAGHSRPELEVFDRLSDMLPGIDILYVATPHALHAESTIPALQSGTAVLAEKALAVHLDDTQAMVAAAREHSTFLMEAVWSRFNPLHVKLRELVSGGALGKLRRVVNDFSFQSDYDPTHRLYDPALGGGALLDLGPYPVSLIQSLLGNPVSVDVCGSRTSDGVDDSATMMFRYPGGVAGIGTCTLLADGPNTASVVGTLARVEIDANALAPTRMTLYRKDSEPEVFTTRIEGSGYVPQLREVQTRVRAGEIESPVMPHDDSLSMMRILTEALTAIGVQHP